MILFSSSGQFTRLNVVYLSRSSKNASGIDSELRPTTVIAFGNPKAGAPLMQCEQNVTIDLPNKVLVSEDANNQVRLS